MTFPAANAAEKKCVEALSKQFSAADLDDDDKDFLDGNTFLRFARARSGNIGKATEMLKKCLEWRRSYKPYAVTREDVAKVMTQQTMTVGGVCRAGYPILGMTLAVPNECETEERVKQLVYILEVTQKKGFDSLTWIIDFSEMGKHPKDERSKETRKVTSQIMQDYYPERLGRMYLYKPPWYISSLLGVAKLFLDAKTRKKIYKGGKTVEDLSKFMEPSQIPLSFGGTYEPRGIEALDLLSHGAAAAAAVAGAGDAAAPAAEAKGSEVATADRAFEEDEEEVTGDEHHPTTAAAAAAAAEEDEKANSSAAEGAAESTNEAKEPLRA